MTITVDQAFEEAVEAPRIDYRREARRLRGQFAKRPIAKQRALADLARKSDRQTPRFVEPAYTPTYTAEAFDAPTTGVRLFAQSVVAHLDGSIIRYSQRQSLLRQAAGLGIKRFDANLIIAAVQSRLGKNSQASITGPIAKQSERRMPWILAAAVVVQLVIFGCAWFVMHG